MCLELKNLFKYKCFGDHMKEKVEIVLNCFITHLIPAPASDLWHDNDFSKLAYVINAKLNEMTHYARLRRHDRENERTPQKVIEVNCLFLLHF